jgi:predicted PurR-regulated permease PerM
MEYYSGLSITICSIATIALILFAWNVEKRILDDEDIPKKNKIIKSILIIIVLFLTLIVYLSSICIPATNKSIIETNELIPQTNEYVEYNNSYVSYYEEGELIRIHLNENTKVYLDNNAKKYKTIKVERKIYTNLFGQIKYNNVSEIYLK